MFKRDNLILTGAICIFRILCLTVLKSSDLYVYNPLTRRRDSIFFLLGEVHLDLKNGNGKHVVLKIEKFNPYK